jgi:small subunit ribosomal protein S11
MEELKHDDMDNSILATDTTVDSFDIDTTENQVPDQSGPVDLLADLPEDIKKKLEKTKTAAKSAKLKKGKKKKKLDKKVSIGKAFIHSTYNNTIVSLTDMEGNILSWASAGLAGFKGPKKSTPYAAQIITKIAVAKAREFGLSEVSVFVKGVGTGRESAVRALNANGLNINFIKDITPMPHNGCRRKKPRRV